MGHPWTEVIGAESVEDKWEAYQDTVMEAYHHCFPEKTVQLHPSDAPWVTHRIKRIMQQRDRAHRLRNMDLYKRLRNKVIREIRIAKKNYHHQRWSSGQQPTKH